MCNGVGREGENAFRVRMAGCLTPISRLAIGPETVSAATGYATA